MNIAKVADRFGGLAFGNKYDGPSLASHEMDVRDHAPTLHSAADMFQTVNRLAHPTDSDAQVNFVATEGGSFRVESKLKYDHVVKIEGNRDLLTPEGHAGLMTVVVEIIRIRTK